MRPVKPMHGLKSLSWTCCGLILSFGLMTLSLLSCREVEQTQGELFRVTKELDEATCKKEITLDLYYRLSTGTENTDWRSEGVSTQEDCRNGSVERAP